MFCKILIRFVACAGLIILTSFLPSQVTASSNELFVSAAISLKGAFEDLAVIYWNKYGVKITFNFGASGLLQRQIEFGASVDVFASSGENQMDRLKSKGLIIEETRKDFARNSIIIVKPKNPAIHLSNIYDLQKEEFKIIAMGNPATVPAGYYTKVVLDQLGLWEKLRPKLIYTENVQHVLTYIKRGEADAGFVYISDVPKEEADLVDKGYIPADNQPPIVYPIAVVRNSSASEMGKAFIELVTSDMGRKILMKHGFGVPEK
ncbi:MAG: molybdate ABC transporter substrate-binding protein [Candidatus Tectomicrobia bacterium]|uniref:Molybdate ABC transporter substrate-binding protein n=1 Tax=Tectimicrobiota bacterium TaxID=2528274 RepID=A0A933LRD1_UNCTE|nr:molybdate ABC transporter substrate-binding protein [Candidatus Tectomicrobia bacterium]